MDMSVGKGLTDLTTIQVRLTKEQVKWLDEQSQVKGVSRAGFIRQLVQNTMEGQEPQFSILDGTIELTQETMIDGLEEIVTAIEKYKQKVKEKGQ